jgi:hypothetical protein
MKKVTLILLIICVFMSGCITVSGELPSILDKPVIRAFSASPAIIDAGEVSILSWSVSGANSVFIDQGVGNVAVSGSTTITPSVTTTYTLTANNAAGDASARCQVAVRGTQSEDTSASVPETATWVPVIHAFKAEPPAIIHGRNTMLSWDVTGATSIFISPDVGPVEPNITVLVSPEKTTIYTLTASNSLGQVVKNLTVVVSPVDHPQAEGDYAADLPLVISESGSMTKSGANYSKSDAVSVGDTTMNLPSRAFLSFDIYSLPVNAVIEEAVLDLGTYTISGNPVYSVSGWGNMGALEVYQYQYDPTADLGRLGYDFPASLVGSLKITDLSGSPLKLDVMHDSYGNNIIETLLASGQSRCQFRVQFFTTTNWDSKADMICLDTAVLHVRYSIPR